MSQSEYIPLQDSRKRAVLLFGEMPCSRDRLIKEALDTGLRVVLAKLSSDHSDTIVAKADRISSRLEADNLTSRTETEIVPERLSDISPEMLTQLRERYGTDWYALPLNDYVAAYANSISQSVTTAGYPPRSAEIVKRKHELRSLWNRLAKRPGSRLFPVEYCYLEQREDGSFQCSASEAFDAMPEDTPIIVKPDELSSSIEVHWAGSKTEALAVAREICKQLRARWTEVGKRIGAQVLPRVVMETAIERSTALHPKAEYSAEFVSFEGRHYPVGVTQKWTGPHFIETGHLFPAESFPLNLKPVLEHAVSEMLTELEVNYGVSHWEFIVTPDERLALVEGHLRAGGDRITELIEHSTGRTPTSALFAAMSQQKEDFAFTPKTSCGIFWMVPNSPLSEVREITVEAAAKESPCKDLHLQQERIRASSNWSHAKDWMSRFAHVIATGDNAESILECCRRAAEHVILHGEADGVPASTVLTLAVDQG